MPATQFHIPVDKLNTFGIRVAKGPANHHHKVSNFDSFKFKVQLFHTSNPGSLFDIPYPLQAYEIEPEIFRYRLGIDGEAVPPHGFLIILEFYHAIGILVLAKV